MSDELEDLRKQIDALDGELLKVLASRMEVVRAVGRYKKANGLNLLDEQRLQALLAGRQEQAAKLDLPKGLVAELYDLIHKYALEAEKEA